MRSESNLTKSDRRKLEYYEQRLKQTLDSIAITSVRQYHAQRRRLFSPGQSSFPDKRIDDALSGVKESRTIEQIGLAIDLMEKYGETVESLAILRQLKLLRGLTKAPNAYKEFLENYTVTGRPEEPGASLKELYDFIRTQNGFEDFRDVAKRLGLQPPRDFEAANEATADAPLLLLYSHLTSSEKVFIKALSFYAYIENNRLEYLQRLDEMTDDITKMQGQLQTLQEDVKCFNEELAYNLLDCTEMDEYCTEVEQLADLLESREQFPSMLAYVVYRFTESAGGMLKEKIQRWASEHGLEGWRMKLRALRNWREELNGIEKEVNSLFEQSQELKTNILGAPEKILKELQGKLENGAEQVFDSLPTGQALDTADKVRVDAKVFTDALEEIRKRLNELEHQANAIDPLLDEIDEVQSIINCTIEKLGDAHDE